MRKVTSKSLTLLLALILVFSSFISVFANTEPSDGKLVNSVPKRAMRSATPSQISDWQKPSLAGTEFGVYSDRYAINKIDTVVIKKDGHLYSGVNKTGLNLPVGTVYVQETKATRGYKLNREIIPVEIKTGEVTEINVKNELDIGEVKYNKKADKKYVRVGDIITYTATMTNTSSTGIAYNAVLEDKLKTGDAAHILPESIKADINGRSFTKFDSKDTTGFKTTKVDLQPNEVMTVVYKVQIDKKVANGTYSNTITPVQLNYQYNINTEVVNGTIDPSMTQIDRGETKTINYTPKSGFVLDKITVDGTPVDVNKYKDKYTFSNINDDHKIVVEYKNGSKITGEKKYDKQSYNKGDTIKNTIKVTQAGLDGSIAHDVKITDKNQPGFKIDTNSIEATSNGKTQPTVKVINKETGEFEVTTAELEAGKEIIVKFDSKTTNSVENLKNDATVESNESEKSIISTTATSKFKVVTDVVNGTIDPTDKNIPFDGNKEVNYKPNTGFVLDKITVDGKDVDTKSFPDKYTFSNIKDDHKIVVKYKSGATVNGEKKYDKQSYNKGDVIKNTIKVVQKGTEGSIAHDVKITDRNKDGFKIDTDSIVATSTGNTQPTVKVTNKETGEFEVTTAELEYGKEIIVKFNSIATNTLDELKNDATVESNESEKSIISTTAKSKFRIITEVVNGTIDPKDENIPFNGDKEVNYKPNEGFELASVSVDGKDVDTNKYKNKYQFTGIKDDHHIKVVYRNLPTIEGKKEFDKKVYYKDDIIKNTIEVKQAGKEGSIARNIVISDKNHPGFKIDTSSIKASISSGATLTPKVVNAETGEFTVTVDELKANETVTVTFNSTALNNLAKIKNTANVTGDNFKSKEISTESESVFKISTEVVNGTIDPTATNIKYDSNQVINFNPTPGYGLDYIEIDGKKVDTGDVNKYEFKNVKENHTIKVVYKGIPNVVPNKKFDKAAYELGETILNTITVNQTGVADSVVEDVVISDENQNGMVIDTDSIKVDYKGQYELKVIDKSTGKFEVRIPKFNGQETVNITFNSIFKTNVPKIENKFKVTGKNIKELTETATATPKYKITTEVVNGTISPVKEKEVLRGENEKVTYLPNDGYKISKVIVDGKEVSKDKFKTEYNFTNVTDSHHVKVIFEGIPKPVLNKTFDKDNYKVGDIVKATIKVSDNGKPTSVSHNVLIRDKNKDGFKIKTDTIKVDVTQSTARPKVNETPKLNIIDADKGLFEVTLDTMDPSQEITISFDMEITGTKGDLQNTAEVYIKENGDKPVTGTAESKLTFDIETSVTGGKITPPVKDIPFDSDKVIEYTPNDGYYLYKVTVDGVDVDIKEFNNNYRFTKIEQNHKIDVEFKKIPTPAITKTSEKEDYTKDNTINYTVVIENKSDVEAEDVIANDILDKATLEKGLIKLDTTSFKLNGKPIDSLENIKIGNMKPGEKATITYEANVEADITDEVKNNASVIARGMTKPVEASNTVNLHEMPKLKVTKESDKKVYKKGEIIHYTVKVTSISEIVTTNLTIADNILSSKLVNVDLDSVKLNGEKADIKNLVIKELAPGETLTLTYSAKVIKNVNTDLENVASVTADWLQYKIDNKTRQIVKEPLVAKNTVKLQKLPERYVRRVNTGDSAPLLFFQILFFASLGLLAKILYLVKRNK